MLGDRPTDAQAILRTARVKLAAVSDGTFHHHDPYLCCSGCYSAVFAFIG